ncbi:regulator of MON1-CCZ1 complex isoform X2 [Neocloeon triangulifer]|uniref:regulator of MON1-CCZ1 complex isoform X2 n=1 Tax=Neocloeon triangulifer TaxID=2078957 RepID=UPI00286F3256|nr:regulator of MON1-CCZ1 complex isoform X2 [Neocloeon triangulifer]
MSSNDFCLQLSDFPIRFEAVSHVTNVFYDDSNKQVFAVRSGGVTGVVVKGPTEELSTSFRMEDKGPVISIKFSPDQKVLAIQRSKTSVEFLNFLNGIDCLEYSQSCKGKSNTIIGFIWTSQNEIVFVTDNGIELFQVVPERRSLKALKNLTISVNWFVHCPQSKLLMLSTGAYGNSIQPLQFKKGNFLKLNKFDVEMLAVMKTPPKLCLLERDVTLAMVYGQACVIVLRHQPARVDRGPGAEVLIYTMEKMLTAKKSHILRLEKTGRFAVNVVDNLILVHHQASKTSMIFDVSLSGDSDGYISYHHPIAMPLPIKPFILKIPSAQMSSELAEVNCELYSPNWVVFQPDIVIDAKLGCLWHVELCLSNLALMISDKCRLVDCLVQRKAGKLVLLNVLRRLLDPAAGNNLGVIADVFDHLNDVYRNFLEVEMQSQMATPASSSPFSKPSSGPIATTPKAAVVIDQSDMYTSVFVPLSEKADGPSGKLVVAVMIEYVRSLGDSRIPVQHYLYELLINTMVHRKAFFQLHQLLQYHVVTDSKPLACLLLSLENLYPAAHQLALDMLKRLGTANEEIVEVLLSKKQILGALRYKHKKCVILILFPKVYQRKRYCRAGVCKEIPGGGQKHWRRRCFLRCFQIF